MQKFTATAVTEIFPEGQKVTAAILEYNCEIDIKSLSANTFSVTDKFVTDVYPMPAPFAGIVHAPRTVTDVYCSTAPEKGKPSDTGKYVIIELSPDDEAAFTFYLRGEHRACRAHMKDIQLMILQTAPMISAAGEILDPPAVSNHMSEINSVINDKTINNIADDFIQGKYKDIKYNLFIPKGYDSAKLYPLIQFIPDAWGVGPDCEISLAQGLGGTVWSYPEEQKKHECFVLVPQFMGPTIVEDDFTCRPEMETAKSLLDEVIEKYSIDKNRIYHTGQSMGFLSGCELNIRYPDLFAANLFVSGFWNPDTMTALRDKNCWFFLSEGDIHAWKTINKAIDNLEAAGAAIGRYRWNGRAPLSELNEQAKIVAADGNRIKFVVFEGESVAREYCPNCHRATWLLAYQIEAVREWLFSTRKEG